MVLPKKFQYIIVVWGFLYFEDFLYWDFFDLRYFLSSVLKIWLSYFYITSQFDCRSNLIPFATLISLKWVLNPS